MTEIHYNGDLTGWLNISGLDDLMRYGNSTKTLYIDGAKIEGDLVIPEGIKSIGWSAFSGCTGLTSVTIPDSVTSIDSYAFSGCTGLTSVTIGNGVTSIGFSAFSGCTSLASVTIGNGVTSIDWSVFSGCSSLTSITIGSGVTQIGYSVFSDCSGLKKVFYNGTAEQWAQISIANNNTNLTSATRYYYSDTEPDLNADGTAYNGNYWHYDTDGTTIIIWKKEN